MSSTDSRQVVIGNEKYPIVISLKEFKGSPLIDIRKYYLDKKADEIKPTKKGIALQKNNYKLLTQALIDSSPQITKWFEKMSEYSAEKATKTLQERADAVEENRRQAQNFKTGNDSWKAPNFFDVESLGGTDKIIFNAKHDIFDLLNQISEKGDAAAINIINLLLMSYKKAKDILDDGEEYSADELFKYLEFEWGLILSNYINKVGPI